jgi:XTP/dITP diphosphohydrolase
MTIIVATRNKHKLAEIARMLVPLGFDVISQLDAGVDIEVEEIGTTFEENAALKAEKIAKLTGKITVADDSGLEVDALNGAPGVYSARYAGEGATGAQLIEKLLYEMRDITEGKRNARFVSVICLKHPDGSGFTVRGECEGVIAFAPSGINGFGYDPVFYIPQLGKTFAELTDKQKDEISHRGNSLQKFVKDLAERGIN